MEEKLRELKEGNRIATALTIIAWVIFVGGFIAGIALGHVEVTMHNEADIWTEKKFSFAVALVYWAVSLISGIMTLGFAEIIKLLEEIKRK